MAALPYIQLYPADYKADTEHLTTLEHGAYLLLIMSYWQTGKPLPDNDRKLAGIAKMTPVDWAEIRPTVAEFFIVEDGEWFHKRIDADLARVRLKQEQASRAGRASAERRKLGENNVRSNGRSTIEDTDTDTDTEVSDKSETQCAGAGAPTPAREGDLFKGSGPDEQPLEPGEKYPAAFEDFWTAYPNKTGKRKAATAYEAAFKRLGGARAGVKRVHAKLLRGAQAYAALCKRDGVEPRYICHAATWLNQSRWDDAKLLAFQQQAAKPSTAPQYVGPELPPEPLPGR